MYVADEIYCNGKTANPEEDEDDERYCCKGSVEVLGHLTYEQYKALPRYTRTGDQPAGASETQKID